MLNLFCICFCASVCVSVCMSLCVCLYVYVNIYVCCKMKSTLFYFFFFFSQCVIMEMDVRACEPRGLQMHGGSIPLFH